MLSKKFIMFSLCVILIVGLCANAFAQKRSRFRSGSEVRSTRSSHSGHSRQSSRSARPARSSTPRSMKEHNMVKEDGRNVIYKKHNVVDFDDSLIEGEVKNPSEFYFVHRPEEKFGSLVKKRKNFHKEMLRDTVMIR